MKRNTKAGSQPQSLDKSIVGRINQIAEELINAREIDASTLCREDVPPIRGVYLWRFRTGEAAYVGVANGQKGLRARIVGQHLGAGSKTSAFRRNIAAMEGIDPEAEAIDFIRSRLTVVFVPCGSDSPAIVAAAESTAIAALRPKYNGIRRSSLSIDVDLTDSGGEDNG